MNGWTGSPEWKVVNGRLVSDGTDTGVNVAPTGSDSVMAPCQLSTPNYAVEANIQIVDTPNNCYLQIRGRVQADGSAYDGYLVGYDSYFGDAMIGFFSPNAGFSPIKSTMDSPGLEEHIYRAEFKDNQITLKIDHRTVLQVIDNRFLNRFALLTANSESFSITVGPDGNLWFTEYNGNQIGRITPGGSITEFALPAANSRPNGITVGPDGNLWFTEIGVNQIGHVGSQ
jgi:hypothetical protein